MSAVQRVEVAFLSEADSIGLAIKNDITEDLNIHTVENIKFSEIYYIDVEGILENEIEKTASSVLIDPLIQKYSINENATENYKYYIEVKLHPDVTDNVGIVALEGMEDFLGRKLEGNVRSARKYYITGTVSIEDVNKIAKQLFANELIETITIGEKSG